MYAPKKTLWRAVTDAKEQAARAELRSSFLIGIDPTTNENIYLSRKLFEKEHIHVSGKTGSGKSTTSLLSLALQVIRGYRVNETKWSQKSPLIFLDLKGDNAVFNAIQNAALVEGRNFRYLVTEPGAGYYFFDPFQNFRLDRITAIDIATEWIRALGLDHGLVYAGQYFTAQNLVLLKDAILLMQQFNEKPSIGALAETIKTLARQPGKKDATHVALEIDLLASYPHVNSMLHGATPYPRLDIKEAMKAGDVCYFHLPCLESGPTMRQIAALALSTTIQAAKTLRREKIDVGPIFVMVDEFYHIAGKNFGDVLAMCREWDLHFVLANQTHSQIKAHDANLPAIIQANTGIKQWFTADEPDEVRYLQDMSGEVSDFTESHSDTGRGQRISFSERIRPGLERNVINSVNGSQNRSLFIDDGNEGEGKRIRIVKTLYPLPYLEYQALRHTPLPSTPSHTSPAEVQPNSVSTVRENDKKQTPVPLTGKDKELQDRLRMKFEELRALETV